MYYWITSTDDDVPVNDVDGTSDNSLLIHRPVIISESIQMDVDNGMTIRLPCIVLWTMYINCINNMTLNFVWFFCKLWFELKLEFILVDIYNAKSIKWNNCVPVVIRLLGGDVVDGDDVPLQLDMVVSTVQ